MAADPFARLGLLMMRLRWPVVAVWLVILVVVGGLLAPRTAKVLKGGGYTYPGSESSQAAAILDEQFTAAPVQSVAAVFRSASQTVDDPAVRAEVTAAADRLARVPHVRSVETTYSSGNPALVSPDRHTTFALVSLEGSEGELQDLVVPLRASLDGVGLEHYVTGFPALNHDLQLTSEEDLRRSEVFTIPIVVVLLLAVFGTVIAAAVPLLIGGGSVVLAMGLLYLIGSRTDVSVFALNVASMIGLGLGIDFSLIMVKRFREGMAAGWSREQAVAVMMATAGRSITYSGVTVLLAMVVLTALFRNLMIIQSISMGVMLVAVTALVAGLTLLPAVLSLLGHRIEWLRVVPRGKPQAAGHEGFWYRLSHRIMRRPWLWLAVSLGILILLALPAKDFQVYGPRADIMPASKESVQGVNVITAAFGPGRLTPVQVVLQAPAAGGAFRPDFLEAVKTVTERAESDPRTQEVFSLYTLARTAGLPPEQFRTLTADTLKAAPGGAQFGPRFVNLNGNNDTTVITVFSKFSQYTPEHEGFVRELRDTILPGIPGLAGARVLVGGSAADFLDFRDAAYNRFPYLVAGVALVSFVVLMMFFQSVFLPIKAIFMNLASILATYGALVLIFQNGWGERLLGFESIGRLGQFSPAVLFAILFGLSTDYEVFMLSRVKEYYHELGNNEEAVAAGLEHTAGVITAAGLILVGTFGSFATGRALPIKEIGIGLAIGVALDSTIVRVIMVPATMRLMGGLNWWMPAWLKKIVPELREGAVPAPAGAPAAIATAAPDTGAGITATAGAGGTRTATAPAVLPSGATQSLRLMRVGRLVPVGGSVGTDGQGIVLPHSRPFRIGRDDDNELQLFDVRVSRYHAQITYEQGRFVVADLGSTNGVYVNGARITAPTVLQPGDQIEIGNMDTVLFNFEMQTLAQEQDRTAV